MRTAKKRFMMSYPWWFRNLIFPLSERMLGTTVRAKLEFLRRSQWWRREDLLEYRDNQLRNLFMHAYTNTAYYRQLFEARGISPWTLRGAQDLPRLPVLTKEIIRARENDLKAGNYAAHAFSRFTSGSTGSPVRFWQTHEDYSWQWAAHFRAWEWAGYSLGDRYAKISINADRHQIKKRIQDMLMNSVYVCAYEMSPVRVERYIRKLISFRPKLVYGYSSSITVLAREMLRKDICYQAAAVVTTGDNLVPTFRKDIEKAFGAKVYDDYGCGGEGLAIANQCPMGSYHINDELLVLEEVDGEAVVTSLNNYAMPLIRYKIGDRITLGGSPCGCGKGLAIIESLDGRSHDVVRTTRGDVLVVHFFTILFEYMQGVDQFKIVQRELGGITIKLVINQKYDKLSDEKHIRQYIEKSVGSRLKLAIEYVAVIPLESNGKYRLIDGMRDLPSESTPSLEVERG